MTSKFFGHLHQPLAADGARPHSIAASKRPDVFFKLDYFQTRRRVKAIYVDLDSDMHRTLHAGGWCVDKAVSHG